MLIQTVVRPRIPTAAKSQPIYVPVQLGRLRARPVTTLRVRAMTAGTNMASMMSMRRNLGTNTGLKMMDMVMDLKNMDRNMDTRSMELRRGTVMVMVRQRTMAMDTVMEVVDMGMITEMALMILILTHTTVTYSSNKL